MSSKFSWIQQKMCEIQIFWQFFTSRYVYKWKSYESSTLAHYLKKEYLRLDIFCFEITHAQLRRYGETSADLAGNFKLTNHMAVEANKRRKQTRKSVRILFRIVSSLPSKYLPFIEEKLPDMTDFPRSIEVKPSNKIINHKIKKVSKFNFTPIFDSCG